jgi:hypothetical protein
MRTINRPQQESRYMTKPIRMPSADALITAMASAMATTIAVTFMAGFGMIPGWMPILPCTVVTMSIGGLLVRQDADLRIPRGRGARRLMTFGTIYGWILLAGSPLVAIIAYLRII